MLSIVFSLLLPRYLGSLILAGVLALLFGFVAVLVAFYKKGPAMPTLLGWVERERQPVFYLWLYVLMFLFGFGILTALASFLLNWSLARIPR
jgi:hypothetical protein